VGLCDWSPLPSSAVNKINLASCLDIAWRATSRGKLQAAPYEIRVVTHRTKLLLLLIYKMMHSLAPAIVFLAFLQSIAAVEVKPNLIGDDNFEASGTHVDSNAASFVYEAAVNGHSGKALLHFCFAPVK
jgi:hypothetical protein